MEKTIRFCSYIFGHSTNDIANSSTAGTAEIPQEVSEGNILADPVIQTTIEDNILADPITQIGLTILEDPIFETSVNDLILEDPIFETSIDDYITTSIHGTNTTFTWTVNQNNKIRGTVVNCQLGYSIRAGEGQLVSGTELFDQMMNHFTNNSTVNITSIQGLWIYGSNLDTVNSLTADGLSLQNAIKRTWAAHMARRYGFSEAELDGDPIGTPGNYTSIKVKFSRPCK